MGRIPAFSRGAGRVTTFGDGTWFASPLSAMLTLMMDVMNNNAARAAPLWKPAIVVVSILYRFSIWGLENHAECVAADKYSGPRCFPEIVYRLLGLESLDLIDW